MQKKLYVALAAALACAALIPATSAAKHDSPVDHLRLQVGVLIPRSIRHQPGLR